ncbi:MAG: sulfotransferase [Nitrosomonas sp.]|nr:MAG: sulfotransferase [Nitrosomonas sp.]
MFAAFRSLLARWFAPARTKDAPVRPELTAKHDALDGQSTTSLSLDEGTMKAKDALVPYDENLLECARTQWQFGDWKSLVKLNRDTLQHHPDRAKLALLAAAGHLQTGDTNAARQFIHLAQDWGCGKKLIAQILTAGVHNSLGRAAALADQQPRALQHFENAIAIGTPDGEMPLITQARMGHQFAQIGIPLTSITAATETDLGRQQIGYTRSFSARAAHTTTKALVRTIHHFSCTGGTLFAKCLAAQPDVVLLNEVDPFSEMSLNHSGKPQFSPRDIISLLHQSGNQFSNELIGKVFCKDISTILDDLTQSKKLLILRDHTHSAYLVGSSPRGSQTLREILRQSFTLKSIVTVRNPIDSYLSLKELGWIHFTPPTFNEYCLRYLRFLQDHQGIRIFRYEDFVRDSPRIMYELCQHLGLDYSPDFVTTFGKFKLSGDSGRSGTVIEPRERRPYTDEFIIEVATAQAFMTLCNYLGYNPKGIEPEKTAL